MVAEASLRNSHCAGLAGRPSFLEFSGKSENRAPRQKKQMASQYLLSLPNTQGIEEKLWGCQTQEGSQTPWSLWSGEETEEGDGGEEPRRWLWLLWEGTGQTGSAGLGLASLNNVSSFRGKRGYPWLSGACHGGE